MRNARPFLSFLPLFLSFLFSFQASAQISACRIPLDESKSAPAVDLIQNGKSTDPGVLIEQIKKGLDTSILEPQLSDVYVGTPQPIVQYQDSNLPSEGDTVNYDPASRLAPKDGLVRVRVVNPKDSSQAYQLDFSIDSHSALAANALMRRLGYAIPSPKYYQHLKVRFTDIAERDQFLDSLSKYSQSVWPRWADGGEDATKDGQLTITFHDVLIESAVITLPPMHWGIFSKENLNARRALRALVVPLTLLDIPELVNLYNFETAKLDNGEIRFVRMNGQEFENETSIGDVKWIAKKIATLTRDDWTQIIKAAHYPADIEALVIEKAIGRANQLLSVLGLNGYKPIPYDPYITAGNVIRGKATQGDYEGYTLIFTDGDPKSPISVPEVSRFFGITAISGVIKTALDLADQKLQLLTPDKYIKAHEADLINDVVNHFHDHPNEPYVQPIKMWGGPVGGLNVSASRNVITGTYYGTDSGIQLVDAVSATAAAGGFFGISGIPNTGISVTPQAGYTRSYVHVRPLLDIKTAWKDNWKNLYVPHFMGHLARVLGGTAGEDSKKAVEAFLGDMKTGEMFIVTDSISTGLAVSAGIPLGALLGFGIPFNRVGESLTVTDQYAILSRVTLVRTSDGLQIYLNRIHSNTVQLELDTTFYVKVLALTGSLSKGKADSKVFAFPEEMKDDAERSAFQAGIQAVLRRNNPHIIEDEFSPFELHHEVSSKKGKVALGPWSWTKRETLHQLELTPPEDKRYHAEDLKRTVLEGQITKIKGRDFYGFFSDLLHSLVPFLNLGNGQMGDDPSSDFMGRSSTFSVSTEIEVTNGRDNDTYTRLQLSYNGWDLKKSKLFKLIDAVSNQLHEFSPSGGLISKDEFAQTRHIQAYTIQWTLRIYEEGIRRLQTLLDLKQMNTRQAYEQMVTIAGHDEYSRYCSQKGLETGMKYGPYAEEDAGDGAWVESASGQTAIIPCLMPWMKTVFNYRSLLTEHQQLFVRDTHEAEIAKEKIKWTNRVLADLEPQMELSQLIRWVGKDQSIFNVSISGFRTKDENGGSKYFSNTVGDVERDGLNSPLAEIGRSTQIQSRELSARYLSDGY